MSAECIFCKIVSGQIPVEPVYEDEEFIAFHDMNPQAPIHVLLIPKAHYETLLDIGEERVLGRGLHAVQKTVQTLNLANNGFRCVVNCGVNGGQTVPHVHWHILGGRPMNWPPG